MFLDSLLYIIYVCFCAHNSRLMVQYNAELCHGINVYLIIKPCKQIYGTAPVFLCKGSFFLQEVNIFKPIV